MHPNPIKERKNYVELLDGWSFSFDQKSWRDIRVPFCPQSKLSGIEYTDFIPICYYKKNFEGKKSSLRTILHFGAVDYRASLYINGQYVGGHVGGYTPFSFDITPYLVEGENELALTVFDEEYPPHSTGKQSHKKQSYGCFYTRTTGIWQPVWLEFVPETRVRDFYFYTSDVDCSLTVDLLSTLPSNYDIRVSYEGREVGRASGEVPYRTKVTIPLCEKHLWTVGEGNLYQVEITVGEDVVYSYFGLRSVCYEGTKFLINGQEVFQKLVLDQGYYPDGVYTAPSYEAMEKDIELALRLGFNGARLHEKVFDPRFLYACDKKGYIVWGEYPSWGIDYSTLSGFGQFISEWEEELTRDFNHPSIITWCPLNEVWGDWNDSKKRPDLRFVDSVYAFTKSFDATRPCVDVSGGIHGKQTDIYDFHCYDNADKLKEQLDILQNENRVVVLMANEDSPESAQYKQGQPANLSEYGGIALAKELDMETDTPVGEQAIQSETAWGYGKGENSADAFIERYRAITDLLFDYPVLSGYCYTQLYDVEQEQNGLYCYDRSDKLTEAQKDEIKKIQSKR